MCADQYVIEARKEDGSLDLSGCQPETVFGAGAYLGIGVDAMAMAVSRICPDAVLTGQNVNAWPSFVDSRWRARPKTW